MAYGTSDPRSQFADSTKTVQSVVDYAEAHVIEFHAVPPSETRPGYKIWYGRRQNFIVSYTEVAAGAGVVMRVFPVEGSRRQESQRGVLREATPQHPALPALAGSAPAGSRFGSIPSA